MEPLTIIKNATLPPRSRAAQRFAIVRDMQMNDAIDIAHEQANRLAMNIKYHHQDSTAATRKAVNGTPELARGMTRVWRVPKRPKKVLKTAQ